MTGAQGKLIKVQAAPKSRRTEVRASHRQVVLGQPLRMPLPAFYLTDTACRSMLTHVKSMQCSKGMRRCFRMSQKGLSNPKNGVAVHTYAAACRQFATQEAGRVTRYIYCVQMRE